MLAQFESTVKRLNSIHTLINTKATGDRKNFAKKVSLSESMLSNYLDYIRSKGIRITFDHINNRYYYDEDVTVIFQCGFKKEQELG